jgi:flagellar motor switch protein FliN
MMSAMSPEESGGMLTQEALDAMLAGMGPDLSDEEIFGSDEEDANQASGLAAAAQDFDPAEPEERHAAPEPAFSGGGFGSSAPSAASKPALSFATFDGVASSSGDAFAPGFERVQDIALDMTVELGRTRLLIRDILELGPGSIIELEKMAGEPVDLLANGLLIARGEVVVIEDNFGVRITEIITAADRRELAGDAMQRQAS